MKPYERLTYPSPLPGLLGNQELLARPENTPSYRVPLPEDLAASLARVSDEWFFTFLKKLRKLDRGRAFAVATFLQEDGVESSPAEIGDFGYDPEDSKRLLELREAIEQELGWRDAQERELGDYTDRLRDIGSLLRGLRNILGAPKRAPSHYASGGVHAARQCANCGHPYYEHVRNDECDSPRCPEPK